jgi:hypothetical protein
MFNRATIAVAAFAALAATSLYPAFAAAQSGDATYRGYHFDLSKIDGNANLPAVTESLRRQIDIIESVGLNQRLLELFRSIPIVASADACPRSQTPACYNGRIVMVRPVAFEAQRPVLLHEMLHAYHHLVLPRAEQNPDILLYYNHAKDAQLYPSGEYLLRNQNEFFAMTASVFLHGSAAREPYTREKLKERQPLYYEHLSRLFGITPTTQANAAPANTQPAPPGRPRPANPGANAGPPAGDCLEKTYLADGRVKFSDRCTGEAVTSRGSAARPREATSGGLLAMALSWNAAGGWAVQKDPSPDVAGSNALAQCNKEFGNCSLSPLALAPTAPSCLAIARGKENDAMLFAGVGDNRDAAAASAMRQLADEGMTGQVEFLDCNGRS